jgi:hypothetical protein
MIKKYTKYLGYEMIFCILLVLFVVSLNGCSQFESKSGQTPQSQIYSNETEGSILITKYMAHISTGEIQEADKFFAPNPGPEIKDDSDFTVSEIKDDTNFTVNDGVGPKVHWSLFLYQRNLVLTKIINEKTEDENTKVVALLEVRKKPNINITATYYLEKRNGIFLIKDIKLTPGKNN